MTTSSEPSCESLSPPPSQPALWKATLGHCLLIVYLLLLVLATYSELTGKTWFHWMTLMQH